MTGLMTRALGERLLAGLLALTMTGCTAEPAGDPDAPPAVLPSEVRDIVLTPDTTLVSGLVPHRTTLDTLLRGHGVADDAAMNVVSAAHQVFDPRRLRALQPFALERTVEGTLRFFQYEIDNDRFLRVAPSAAGSGTLAAIVVPIPKTLERVTATGRIDAETPSLFQSVAGAGEGAELAVSLAQIFSGEIDFNSDLQPGDAYTLAFDKYTREGGQSSYGDITVAEFRNDGRVLRAIRFAVPGGKPAYYDERGRSLRRFFLRSPLKFEPRVTSRFSSSRRHPVLHTARAHRGVDYAAPTGAPVIAAAAGVVVSASFDRTNGRMVRVRHASGYESFYLHLSAFGQGIRGGVRVDQGQTIGLVGATGLATGPHLHYGLTRNGVFVNPLREHMNQPPGEPVPTSAMDAFMAERDRALAQLEGKGQRPL
ncbi:MAG TPA: M23 family metallopeptidase [Vicinamibacterales bacterium]|nr:M23 family metallopeptidase [Vicinamibacterales bacterium]